MTYRVVQWATGGVGRAAIEGIVRHPDLELAGCWVHTADKDGADLGTIAGLDPLGVRATGDVDAILALDADCVIYAPMIPQLDEVIALLRSGKNVVTPVGCSTRRRRTPARSAPHARTAASACTGPASTPAASPTCIR